MSCFHCLVFIVLILLGLERLQQGSLSGLLLQPLVFCLGSSGDRPRTTWYARV
jgi:hypothetical protein